MSELKYVLIANKSLKEDFLKKVENGEIKMIDSTINFKKEITGGAGAVELVEGKDIKQLGVTDLMNGKLAAGLNFVCNMIKVEVASHATITDPLALLFQSTRGACDVSLQHAKLELIQEGTVLFDEAISSLVEATPTEGASGQIGYHLRNPFSLVEDTPITARLTFPTPMQSTDKFFISVTLGGEKTALI